MSDSNPEPLVKLGSQAVQSVACAQCGVMVAPGEYFTYQGAKKNEINLCKTCRDLAEAHLQKEVENPNVLLAVAGGVLGGALGGLAWYLFVILTKYELGYIAIGVAWLVGQGVVIGSGKKRGPQLQLVSVLIALAVFVVAQYFLDLYYIRQSFIQQKLVGYDGHFFWVNPFNPQFMKVYSETFFSPMGLFIKAIGIYFAFKIPKSRTLK